MNGFSPQRDGPWLAEFIRQESGADEVRLSGFAQLSGGAIQENLAFEADIQSGGKAGKHRLVLRRDAATHVAASRPRDEEFHLLKAAWDAGVTVPEPLWLGPAGRQESEEGLSARPFYIMRRVEGEAGGHILTKPGYLDAPEVLAEELGRQLATIHAIRVRELRSLAFLGEPPADPITAEIAGYRRFLDEEAAFSYPALEWGLRWCETQGPKSASGELCLVHRDFRTGNYLVRDGKLAAILDWEFADWGDPMSDIGWFCAACWRFRGENREAGGIASRKPFYRGYESRSGRKIDPEAIYFWEVMAHLRWAVIALQQGARFTRGGEASLDLALTGRVRPDEISYAILEMTKPEAWRSGGQRERLAP